MQEGEYTDGRRPDVVEYTDSILEDLRRRDFTINAIAFDPLSRVIIDPFGGLADLESDTLKVVVAGPANVDGHGGEAEVEEAGRRMREDGLRIWRAYRFMDNGKRGTRAPDPALARCLADGQSLAAAGQVSPERIWDETRKILRGFSAPRVMHRMADNSILQLAFNLQDKIQVRSTTFCEQSLRFFRGG